jgi:hypothetical protein
MWERRWCVEDGVEIMERKAVEVCLYKQSILSLKKGERGIGGVSANFGMR